MSEAPRAEVELVFEGPGGGWRPVHVFIDEGMSRLYEASLILANRNVGANAEEMFEREVSLEIQRGSVSRPLKGIVRRVEDLGSTGMYRFARIVVVPHLWALSKRVNSRIWQDVNVLTIIEEVLKDAGVYQGTGAMGYEGALDQLPPRENCVQYRETDLAFVERLLEEEGVAYYFKHDGDAETWQLVEDGHAWEAVPTMDGAAVSVVDTAGSSTSGSETVMWFDWHRRTGTTGVLLRDFDFTHPRAVLDMSPRSPGDGGQRPVYDYPARFTLGPYDDDAHVYKPHQGQKRSRIRFEETQVENKVGHGRSTVTGFWPGRGLTMTGHARAELDRNYVLLGVQHHVAAWGDIPDDIRESEHVQALLRSIDPELESIPAGGAAVATRYWNRFECVASDTPIRPERDTPRPLVHGPQTALVIAAPGEDEEEISTDFHGRILVRFHWDRPELRGASQSGSKSSCWMRVAQAWAGAAWGTMFIPRIGMEVVVTFLEGDPDRPLVTGCVYNGENNTPYPLPAEKTKSTIKTSSSKGSQGFNELRFEDLKDNEQIFIHAQRDMDSVVRHDQTLVVGHDRTKTIQGMEHVTVQKDRITSIVQNDSLDVEGNSSIAVHGGAGASLRVDTHYALTAESSMGFKVGDSSIMLLPNKITINSPTIQIIGGSLVNINGALVKINCGETATNTIAAQETTAAKAVALQGMAGGILEKLKNAINPAQIAEQVSKGLKTLLAKAGVPDRIATRLEGIAKTTVTELATALKEGRKPNFAKIGEEAITKGVQDLVGEAFKGLEENPRVKNSPLLSGLVKEMKGVTTTAATWGVLRAANINDGMARDPFWTVLQKRNGADVATFLKGPALAAGQEVFQAWVDQRGLPPQAAKLVKQGTAQLNKVISQQVDKLFLPH
ncbi:MAG: Type secretion protein Rhs [Myxococcaceae bacterium]|nr:Type secretion protein Rhs [Myxococcaceae bacterium]